MHDKFIFMFIIHMHDKFSDMFIIHMTRLLTYLSLAWQVYWPVYYPRATLIDIFIIQITWYPNPPLDFQTSGWQEEMSLSASLPCQGEDEGLPLTHWLTMALLPLGNTDVWLLPAVYEQWLKTSATP